METTLLTIKNAHRAKTVRRADQPDGLNLEFQFRAVTNHHGFMSCTFSHIAVSGDHKEEISDRTLSEWIVTEWKYTENLEHLWNAGVNAFSGTSHVPEERAAQYIREYEAEIQEDLASMPEDERATYFEKYSSWVSTLFSKHSRVASAMIVGPAKFPTRKNQSAQSSYEYTYNEFREWREKYLKGVERRKEAAKPQEQRDEEELTKIKRDITGTAETIFAIDTQNAPCHRPLFVSNLYGRLSTIAKNTRADLFIKVMDFVKETNDKLIAKGGKPIFTARHKVWKLVEEAEARKAAEAERAGQEEARVEFDGGVVIKNYAENRLQIFHDDKPSYEVITSLKKEGWRWSRNNGCWQRQLTDNAYYSAARIIIGADFEKNEIRSKFVKKLQAA